MALNAGGHSRRRSSIAWPAVGKGAAAFLAIAVPCGIIIAVVHGQDPVGQESNLWVVAAVVVIVVAPLAGGAVAGWAEPRAPLSHGAAAVYVPAGIFLIGRTVVGLVDGTLDSAQVISFLLYLMVLTGLGVIGGYLAFWRQRSRPV